MAHGKRRDMVVHEAEPYNAEPPTSALAGQLLTGPDAFYSRNHGPVPKVDPDTWRLTVDGLVTHPLHLSLDQLRDSYPVQTLVATLQCAGNRRQGLLAFGDIPGEAPWGAAISTAEWTGVRLSDLLPDADVHQAAKHVEFLAPDVAVGIRPAQPYGSSIPIEKARAGEVLLAWAMNGEALPAAHGAPVRIVVPGYIGARSVKWVERITALPMPSTNYFQAVAYRLPAGNALGETYPDRGVALTHTALNCDILRPDDGAVLKVGATAVAGYTIAGEGGEVAWVELSIDQGRTWHKTELDDPSSTWAWRHWQSTVHLPAGNSQIIARAWDSSGATQPALASELWNPKGYVNNSWARIAVTAEA